MGQLIGSSIGGQYVGLIVAVLIVAGAVAYRFYMMKRPGAMRAKCPKCGNVFNYSRSFSALHFGGMKQMKCPACGKISFMRTGIKDSLTWPPEGKEQEQQLERQLTQEELEEKRIEESKYERS